MARPLKKDLFAASLSKPLNRVKNVFLKNLINRYYFYELKSSAIRNSVWIYSSAWGYQVSCCTAEFLNPMLNFVLLRYVGISRNIIHTLWNKKISIYFYRIYYLFDKVSIDSGSTMVLIFDGSWQYIKHKCRVTGLS